MKLIPHLEVKFKYARELVSFIANRALVWYFSKKFVEKLSRASQSIAVLYYDLLRRGELSPEDFPEPVDILEKHHPLIVSHIREIQEELTK